MNVGNLTWSRIMHVITYYKNFWFFKKESGEGLTERPPQTPPPPPIFSRALPSDRASSSILERFAPSIQALPWTSDWKTRFAPQNIFMDPLLAQRLPLQNSCLRPYLGGQLNAVGCPKHKYWQLVFHRRDLKCILNFVPV